MSQEMSTPSSLGSTATIAEPPAIYPARSQEKDEEKADVESEKPVLSARASQETIVDLEHHYVLDDPRQWSDKKKNLTLAYICWSGLAGGTLGNIIFPTINSIQEDLGMSDTLISVSVSLFILLLGCGPILWSMLSELYGRKPIYLLANSLLFVSCLCNGLAVNGPMFVAFRILSALGGSAVLNLGAGTLADIYEPSERGTKMGVFYAAPMIGPSVGTLLAGILGQVGGWRAPFYLMAAYSSTTVALTFFFHDTFRPERSNAWIAAKARKDAAAVLPNARTVTPIVPKPQSKYPLLASQKTQLPKPSFSDVSPFGASSVILKKWNNVSVILTSGMLFASQYQLTFTASKDFALAPWNYNDLLIALVLLAFGGGNVIGSVVGGRYSDFILKRLTKKNNGVREPEMRISSTYPAMPFLPAAYLIYAWTVEKKTSVAGPAVALAIGGISQLWVYSSTLAYLVDANPGYASTVIAYNSACRGLSAFTASQIADTMMAKMGNGWLYTGWAIVLCITQATLVVIARYGKGWREKGTPAALNAQ